MLLKLEVSLCWKFTESVVQVASVKANMLMVMLLMLCVAVCLSLKKVLDNRAVSCCIVFGYALAL